jgi:hypothetical protein
LLFGTLGISYIQEIDTMINLSPRMVRIKPNKVETSSEKEICLES